MPTISETNAPYVLRSCLSNEPLERVKNVDDDLKEIWARLNEKYGDPAKVTDVIISEIQNFKSIKDGDNHKFLEFISMIENAYRDLALLVLLRRNCLRKSKMSGLNSSVLRQTRKISSQFCSNFYCSKRKQLNISCQNSDLVVNQLGDQRTILKPKMNLMRKIK